MATSVSAVTAAVILHFCAHLLIGAAPSGSAAQASEEADRSACGDLDFGQFTFAPAFCDSVPPEYPFQARLAQLEGTVVLNIFVTAEGEVCATELLQGVNPLVDAAAGSAAAASSYHPATRDGRPVPGILIAAYKFDLADWFAANIREADPPPNLTPPLISELGREISCEVLPDGTLRIFEFEGLQVVGDVSLATFRAATDLVTGRLEEGEEIIKVTHHLNLPQSRRRDFLSHGDLEVTTCTSLDSRGNCERGRAFSFRNIDGVYALKEEAAVKSWIH